eukprot:GHRQ01028251.1.p1 GENE.GHRQ01028251.1~~GHRQ01028251.1.p1  ORF type:complete len:390 (+),score=126.37 GHRQ01028251.1:177-1346(+)
MLWSPARSALRAVPLLTPGQLVSAVPGMYSLTKKRRLSSTLSAAYGEHAWQLVPQSYSLPAELQQWRAWLDEQAAAGADPGPWMLKTAQHLGKGLVLLPGEAAHTAAQQPRLPSAKPFVLAQRYVSNPLLINGCKFGIRLWLLVTGVDPFTCYLHRQGLVLFSTDRYDLDSLSDDEGAAARGHITNYAQNVNGNVWSLDMLKQHLGEQGRQHLAVGISENCAGLAGCRKLRNLVVGSLVHMAAGYCIALRQPCSAQPSGACISAWDVCGPDMLTWTCAYSLPSFTPANDSRCSHLTPPRCLLWLRVGLLQALRPTSSCGASWCPALPMWPARHWAMCARSTAGRQCPQMQRLSCWGWTTWLTSACTPGCWRLTAHRLWQLSMATRLWSS